jgi:hypothetical protein
MVFDMKILEIIRVGKAGKGRYSMGRRVLALRTLLGLGSESGC